MANEQTKCPYDWQKCPVMQKYAAECPYAKEKKCPVDVSKCPHLKDRKENKCPYKNNENKA